jgi:RND family efflux transporter MFP subunit
MKSALLKLVLLVLLGGGAAYVALEVQRRIEAQAAAGAGGPAERQPAPVEVAPIEQGPIALRRTFSGALEATARFVVAPKVGGRIERIGVDIADPVRRGEVLVWLDDDELVQAIAQAEADLAVARANATEAGSALEIARRELKRIESLQGSGVTSESQLDVARADELAQAARLEVAKAQVTRAEASLESARIRLSYTQVAAAWSGGDDERVVSERYVDEGETVGANTPLLSIVELDPITGVLFVPERDYARLEAGQPVTLTTQAFPGETFEGRIERIAPVFRESTRQARVELTVANEGQGLKPGMFVRATVVLARVEDATIVPEAALTERGDGAGVFVLSEDREHVRWCPVEPGVRDAGRVEVRGSGLAGEVVTLGQQLIEDGARVTVAGGDA